MAQEQKRGRPPKAATGTKAASFTARIDPNLRKDLEAAAAAHSISLSEEIESRLARSFDAEREREQVFAAFGEKPNYSVCRLIGELMRRLDTQTGKSWAADRWTFDQLQRGIKRLMDELQPAGNPVRPKSPRTKQDCADDLGERTAAGLLAAIDFLGDDPNWRDVVAGIAPDIREYLHVAWTPPEGGSSNE